MLVFKSDGVAELMKGHGLPISGLFLIKSLQIERFLPGSGNCPVSAIVANERVVAALIKAYANVSCEVRGRYIPGSVLPGGRINAEVKLQISELGPFRDRGCNLLMKRSISSAERNL